MAASGALAGRWAVITGASRGIGAECARLLHAEGAHLVLLGRDFDRLSAMLDSLGDVGSTVAAIAGDFADRGQFGEAVQRIRNIVSVGPDVIVNNAATFFLAPAQHTSVEEFERTIAVNLTASFALIREFLPGMRERGKGHIVTMGSIADHRAFRGNAAYGASKYALRGLHEVLRAELRGTGVRTTLVSPGHTDTDIWQGADADLTRGAPSRENMLDAVAVAEAVRWALVQPADVNVDELRLSRS